jgi:hypothetical protein
VAHPCFWTGIHFTLQTSPEQEKYRSSPRWQALSEFHRPDNPIQPFNLPLLLRMRVDSDRYRNTILAVFPVHTALAAQKLK